MDTVRIEGTFGPGRTGKFNVDDVREFTFDFHHKVVFMIDSSGRRHEFDLAQVKGIRAANPGGNLLIELKPTL